MNWPCLNAPTQPQPQQPPHGPAATGLALVLLFLPLKQRELDLHHPTKLHLWVQWDVEHAGAIYFSPTRLGGVAFAGWSSPKSFRQLNRDGARKASNGRAA